MWLACTPHIRQRQPERSKHFVQHHCNHSLHQADCHHHCVVEAHVVRYQTVDLPANKHHSLVHCCSSYAGVLPVPSWRRQQAGRLAQRPSPARLHARFRFVRICWPGGASVGGFIRDFCCGTVAVKFAPVLCDVEGRSRCAYSTTGHTPAPQSTH